jgi:hypothetical protein
MTRRKSKGLPAKTAAQDFDRIHRGEIGRLAKLANWFIWLATATIALVFAGVTMKDIPFSAISNTNPEYFQAIVLSVYIWCWAFGATFDTSIQSSAYAVDPSGGGLRWGSVAAVLCLTAMSVLLVIVRANPLYFALALLGFICIDVATWLYLRHSFLPPIINASRERYRAVQDNYGLIQLDIVVAQITGNWKWWRHAALFAIVVIMVIAAAFPVLDEWLANKLHRMLPAVAAEAIRPLLQDFLLLLFLLISEIWLFLVRFQTYLTIRLLNRLEAQFTIARRSAAAG